MSEEMDQVNRQIGAQIAHYRNQRGWTQEELAGRINESRQTLSLKESGVRPISMVFLYRVSRALGVTPEELMPSLEKNACLKKSIFYILKMAGAKVRYSQIPNSVGEAPQPSEADTDEQFILESEEAFAELNAKLSEHFSLHLARLQFAFGEHYPPERLIEHAGQFNAQPWILVGASAAGTPHAVVVSMRTIVNDHGTSIDAPLPNPYQDPPYVYWIYLLVPTPEGLRRLSSKEPLPCEPSSSTSSTAS